MSTDNNTESRFNGLLPNLILGLVVLVFCIGLLEFGVRLIMPQHASWLAIYERHPRLPFPTLLPDVSATVDTGETNWVVYTDSNGRRRGSMPTAQSSLPQALVLGDSFTFGQGVDHEETYVGLLDLQPGRQFQFINSAVGGYGPNQYRLLLEDLLQEGLKPSVVLVATFIGNDFQDTVWNKDIVIRDGLPGDQGDLKSLLKRNSHAYRLIANLYHKAAGIQRKEETAASQLANPDIWNNGMLKKAEQKYAEQMEAIAARCSELGLPLVFLVIPSANTVREVQQQGMTWDKNIADERLPLVRARLILDSLGAPVIDPTMILSEHPVSELYFQFDGHFTPKAHRIVAEMLGQNIAELGQDKST